MGSTHQCGHSCKSPCVVTERINFPGKHAKGISDMAAISHSQELHQWVLLMLLQTLMLVSNNASVKWSDVTKAYIGMKYSWALIQQSATFETKIDSQ